MSEAGDEMKRRAESAPVPKRVQGMDGRQWAAAVTADPMRTLPPGAAWLIVSYYEDCLP